MPTSANITTAGVVAFTLPQGAWGVRIANESDTTIRRLLGAAASTSGATLGIPIAAGAAETIVFDGPLKQKLDVCAIHAGSGNKTLTYEVITQPTAGGGVQSSGAGAGTPSAITNLDCSANPNYPAASKGARYLVTVAGKVGGASGKVVEVGDVVEAIADNGGGTEAAVGSSWIVFQTNIAGLSITAGKSVSFTHTLTFAGASDGLTLTIPATGTAALREAANTFTANQSLGSSYTLDWNGDLILGRSAAAVLQLGVNHATTATAQTLVSHSVTTGTGANMIIGAGTGSVAGGSVILATRATTGALTARLTVGADGVSHFSQGTVRFGDFASVHALRIATTSLPTLFGSYASLDRGCVMFNAGIGYNVYLGSASGNITFGSALDNSPVGNQSMLGYAATNTQRTFTFGATVKNHNGAFTGDGHIVQLVGGTASSVTTGGAGGGVNVTGGAAAGSGNNNGGDVTLSGGAKTGSGTVGNIIMRNLPTSSAGLPTGALYTTAGALMVA